MRLMARTLGGKALVSRMELSIIMWPLHWTSNRYTSGFLFLGLLSCMIDHLDYLNFCSVLLCYMKTCPVSPIIFCCLYGYDWPIHCNIMCQIINCYFIYIFMKLHFYLWSWSTWRAVIFIPGRAFESWMCC